MGRSRGSIFCNCGMYSTCFHRQENAAADAGYIWSDRGADGYCGCCRVVGLSNTCMVVLSAMVLSGAVFVDLLGSVSITINVEKDAVARQYSNVGGQHCGGRQRVAMSANQCFYDCLFGADG